MHSRCDSTLYGKNSDSMALCPVPTDKSYQRIELYNTERKVSNIEKQVLPKKLLKDLSTHTTPIHNKLLYLSPDVLCGLSITVVDTIAANCHNIIDSV